MRIKGGLRQEIHGFGTGWVPLACKTIRIGAEKYRENKGVARVPELATWRGGMGRIQPQEPAKPAPAGPIPRNQNSRQGASASRSARVEPESDMIP